MPEFLQLVVRTFVAAVRSRRDLALENLVLQHQLQVALRTNPNPRLHGRDRILWVWLRRLWPAGWRQHLRVVQPETVLRWHRKGWRLYWTWKSRTRLGRPHLRAEVRALIARISHENPLWGTERIRGELLKLGLVVSNRSIRRYRWRRLRPGDPQRWRTFLANQLRGIWAADLFVVQTVGYRILYVFFLIRHERRELVHFNVTASPTAAWIWRQLLEATPLGRQPRFLIHDRDAVYGSDFDPRLANLGIAGVRTPPRAPKANAIGERLVRTLRTECLDHLIVIDEHHLRVVLDEFADYYNCDRPHRSLGLQSPLPGSIMSRGQVLSRPVLGGLHHVYARAA
ncbi:MAG TPA: integrase core domain-containing protein [Candidatus Dormibacteraeota bacterium]|nr:integrase core domain-containing protein [Candidatus Dormibacteraeota bacterium]